MDQRLSKRAKAPERPVAIPHARGPLDEASRRETIHSRLARSIPSELAVLLAEIDRLQAELKVERERVTALEAAVDIDALTNVFNRRGFERELKRSLAYVKRYWTRAALICVDLD